jgi:hypothetical protein
MFVKYNVDLLDDDVDNIKTIQTYMNKHLQEDEEQWTELDVIKAAYDKGMRGWLKKVKHNR